MLFPARAGQGEEERFPGAFPLAGAGQLHLQPVGANSPLRRRSPPLRSQLASQWSPSSCPPAGTGGGHFGAQATPTAAPKVALGGYARQSPPCGMACPKVPNNARSRFLLILQICIGLSQRKMVPDPFEKFARLIVSADSIFWPLPFPHAFAGLTSHSPSPVQIHRDQFQVFALVWMLQKGSGLMCQKRAELLLPGKAHRISAAASSKTFKCRSTSL